MIWLFTSSVCKINNPLVNSLPATTWEIGGGGVMGWGKTSSTSNTIQRPCDRTISQTPEHSIIIIIIIMTMHEILKFNFAWICCI